MKINKDDEEYIGKIKNGKYNGEGEIKYKSGDMYKGEWKDGKKEGKGIYI